MIHQVQADRPLVEPLNTDTFMRDVKEDLQGVFAGPVQPAFMVRYTGSNMISN
jgi:hypothetical protein